VPQQSLIFFPMGTKYVLIVDGNEAMQKLRARGGSDGRPKVADRQRSPELIAEDERLTDGLQKRNGRKARTNSEA
jgi:hypothetical protein